LYNHNADQVLGRVGSGTLRLEEDDTGLRFELDLPDTSYARDLSALVQRGDVAGCSFAFAARPGGELWEEINGETIRTLTALDLGEITITAQPAYPDTTVAKRNRPMTQGFVDLNRKWLETV
jgi:HK97 family phage prohead protease